MLFLASLIAGCGGGSTQSAPAPTVVAPGAAADYSVSLSATALSLPQGGVSPPVTITVDAKNGFASSVQLTLGNLPAGVASNPTGAITVVSGGNVSIVFGASTAALLGNFTVTAQAVSGSLSHSATFTLAVETSTLSNFPRTAYARTDATFAADDPPGEPHHRHIAYDAANQHLFVANRAMNRVEVFSTTGGQPFEHIGSSLARIDVPGASSADISPDGTTVWIGTITQQVVAINTASVQVTSHTSIHPISPIANATFDRPEEILALSGGNFLIRVRQSSAPQSVLALWNPATNALTNLNSAVSNGLGPIARTGDHARVLVAASDTSGALAILDSNGNVAAGPLAAGNGAIPFVAANPDGSCFALALVANGVSQIILLDGGLSQIAALPSAGVLGLMFSRDGKFLYASQSTATPAIQVFDGHTLQTIGQIPDLSVQGVHSEVEDADDTRLLFGISNRGVTFIDAANPNTLPLVAPSFAFPPVAQPSEGPAAGGTGTALTGANFESTVVVAFGSQAATSVSVASATQLQASSPPSAAGGSTNVAAYFPSGWLTIAPDAFSDGPQILKTLPNAGNSTGGDVIQIYGYGFGTDAARPTVTIGGAAANIQAVENIAAIEPLLGVDSTYPFPLQSITLQTPAGTAGKI